ncbi:MAG: VOC family protein [Planctomycetota bacterium]
MSSAVTKNPAQPGETQSKQSAAPTIVQPYLFFGGRCEEALAFYTKAIGAQVEMVMKFSDSPQPMPPGMLQPGFENKVMHSSFRVGESTIIASDGCGEGGKFEGFSLSLAVKTEAEADRAFAALCEGGKVTMPLAKTFWSPRYGMLTDRFGIGWMVSVPAACV